MNKKIGYGFDIITGINEIKKIKISNVSSSTPDSNVKKYYRVQLGAYSIKANAERLQTELKKKGYASIIKFVGNLYKVQLGAYSVKSNADALKSKLEKLGYKPIIVFN